MQRPAINITAQTHSPLMKMDSTLTPIVRAAVSVHLLEPESEQPQSSVAMMLVLDTSTSTADPVSPEGNTTINEAIRAAAIETINRLGDDDQIGIIVFNSNARVVLPLRACDQDGKEQAIAKIDQEVIPGGSTNYTKGLALAQRELAHITETTRAISFLSDGAHNAIFGNPLTAAEEIRNSGIVIYTAAISENLSASDEARLKEMSGGANFKACLSAPEVSHFLTTALKKAQKAAVTNARLEFRPINLVQEVQHCELVLRNGHRNYLLGSSDKTATVELGEIGQGDRLDAYIQFRTRMANFREDVDTQERTFGQLVVIGACPSLGINEPTELGRIEMRQRFGRVTTGRTVNKHVESVSAQALAARAIDQASKTSNAHEQQQILNDAATKVRSTQVFVDDAALDGTLTDLQTLQDQARTQGGEAAKKAAGRSTQVFVD